MKVIAAIDLLDGSVVRLVRGSRENKTEYSKNPAETACKWADAGADMLHIVDLNAAFDSGSNSKVISDIISAIREGGAKNKEIPIQVAGGLRTPEAVETLLGGNASRVVIGTMAYSDPAAVKKLSKKYPDRLIVSVDQKAGNVMVKGWQEASGTSVQDSIAKFQTLGINEFLLTSIDRDGTLEGPDLDTLSSAVYTRARIIASGGISSIEDVLRVKSVGCSAVILGKALYDGKVTIEKAKAIA